MTALTRALLSGLAVVIGLGAEGTVGGDWAMASNSTTHTSRGGEWLEWAVTLLPPVGGASELEVIEKQIEWKHNLVLWAVPASTKAMIPELVQSWLVNLVLGMAVYLLVGVLWALSIYRVFRNTKYGIKDENIPSWEDMRAQMRVSIQAIPLYTMLPPFAEWFIRNGYTLCYSRVDTVGWPMYAVYFVMYMASVEFGVYWMHRKLHEVRLGYKFLHATHHVYNKENSLSPFAGLAFNPLDGMLQAIPYVWTLALVPMHFLTHEALLFATAIWTTSIHDCVYGGGEPVMGAGYHLIHHTTYKHNYGHYLTVCDWAFGTLQRPPGYKGNKAQ